MTDTQTITDAELDDYLEHVTGGWGTPEDIAASEAEVEADLLASSVVEFTDFMTDACPSDWANSLYFQES